MVRFEAIGIIPARYGSSRLPGKPLLLLAGKPLVWHVVERARQARRLGRVLVATDDERIRDAVSALGGEAIMTHPGHPSGTDRVAEAARALPADVVINIQGDEPLLDPAALDRLVEALEADPALPLATLRRPAREEEAGDPNVVKVVCDPGGNALYFSRAAVPHRRGGGEVARWAHLGVYGFRRDALLRFAALPPSPLELIEGLEQLRALENGWRIRVVDAGQAGPGVDTPEDLERARAILEAADAAR